VSRISGQGEFADYRAIGTGAAIAPILGVVISAKNETRNFDQFFSTFIKRVDYSGILSPESLIAMSGTPAAVGRLGCGERRRDPVYPPNESGLRGPVCRAAEPRTGQYGSCRPRGAASMIR
jgi:hypothetical protein